MNKRNVMIICFTVLLIGCSSDEKKAQIISCENKGGIPIRSIWDDRLVDCVFPPVKEDI